MTLVAMAGLVVLPVLAADPGTDNPSMAVRPTSADMFLQSGKLIDARVQNTSGEKLGTIEDIVLTADHRMVLYAVLSHGGAMGIHEKYFAVPWSALTVQTKDRKVDYLVLDISKDTLGNAQGFDHKNWPLQADTSLFKTSVAGPAVEAGNQSAITKCQRVSELTGLSVRNQQKESLGDIECLLPVTSYCNIVIFCTELGRQQSSIGGHIVDDKNSCAHFDIPRCGCVLHKHNKPIPNRNAKTD